VTERDPIIVSVPEAIEEFRHGRFVIITDDEDRENEGDLVIAAQFVTPDAINFMAKFGRGLVCCSITASRVHELQLPMMSEDNS
jgi:3,4-dihydroxy 2-butanone 4-phosphate synthase/GTP cyclohydrolase II